MNSIITHGIEISVQTRYYAPQSDPKHSHYFFVYEITITNKSEYTVKLLKRHWDITDGLGTKREVEGDGVIGLTPEINPGETFKYFSNVVLRSGVGSMSGVYFCINLHNSENLAIDIPKFNLMAEVLSN